MKVEVLKIVVKSCPECCRDTLMAQVKVSTSEGESPRSPFMEFCGCCGNYFELGQDGEKTD